jgi:hypothetical protein
MERSVAALVPIDEAFSRWIPDASDRIEAIKDLTFRASSMSTGNVPTAFSLCNEYRGFAPRRAPW